MSDDKAFEEIMDALYRLRAAFLKNGMNAPISIELADIKDADCFRYKMPSNMVLALPRMGEEAKDAEWVANIMGIEIRMPGRWRRGPGGRNHFI